MKITNSLRILAFAFLIVLSQQSERKHHSRIQHQAQVESEDVSACEPGVYDVKVSCGDNYGTSFAAKLDAREIDVPADANIRGLVLFTSGVTSDSTCGILKTQNNISFIDYTLAKGFEANTPGTTASFISGQVSVSNSVVNFHIEFKYSAKWPYITDENVSKIVGWINNNRVNRQSDIIRQRDGAITAATSYKNYLDSASSAGATGEVLKAKTKALNDEITALNTANTNLQKQYTTYQAQIDAENTKISTAANTESQKSSQAQTVSGNKKSLEDKLKQLQTDQKSTSDLSATYQSRAATALKEIKDQFDGLKDEVANYYTKLSGAYTDLQSNFNVNSFNSVLTDCLS
jgi:DNA repair exonuclease SbcCD ATPase subunit